MDAVKSGYKKIFLPYMCEHWT